MKCKNCGAELSDSARFCVQCGARTERKQIVQNNYNQDFQSRQQLKQQVPRQSQMPQKGTGAKMNSAAIAIVAAIAMIIAGAAAFVFVAKPKMDQASDYKQAIAYASAGDYKQAADMFAYLGDYKDSEQKYLESKMEEAKKLLKEKDDFDTNFSEAEEILTSVEEKQSKLTEDGKRKLENLQEQCRNYKKASQYMEDENYEDAKEILQKMDPYPAVEAKLDSCNANLQSAPTTKLYGSSGQNYDSIDHYDSDDDYDDNSYDEYDNYDDDSYEDYDDESDEYIIPYSDSVLLSEEDVEDLTWREVALARNEIYARHGYIFTKDATKEYFSSKDWYNGTVSDQMKIYKNFSDVERKNVDFLSDYEEERFGGRYSW